MAFSIVPFLSILTFWVTLASPLWSSFHALFAKQQKLSSRQKEVELVQWTVYWIFYVLFEMFEGVFSFLPEYVPLFRDLKLCLFFWLSYSEFQGAAWLWFNVLEKLFKLADDRVVDFVETKLQGLMSFALGAKPEVSKAEKFVNSRTATEENQVPTTE